MKLVMAVSADGFVARGPDDNMMWTGKTDKFAFRLLTLSDGQPLFAGRRTAEAMPKLPGRELYSLSRSGLTLLEAYKQHPAGWLIGGPEVAVAALSMGLVGRAFICHVPEVLGHGISGQHILNLLPAEAPELTVKLDGYNIDVYTGAQQWPVK
jgi:dihydrofolate reductase